MPPPDPAQLRAALRRWARETRWQSWLLRQAAWTCVTQARRLLERLRARRNGNGKEG